MESWLLRPPSITAFSNTGHTAVLVFGFLALRDTMLIQTCCCSNADAAHYTCNTYMHLMVPQHAHLGLPFHEWKHMHYKPHSPYYVGKQLTVLYTPHMHNDGSQWQSHTKHRGTQLQLPAEKDPIHNANISDS